MGCMSEFLFLHENISRDEVLSSSEESASTAGLSVVMLRFHCKPPFWPVLIRDEREHLARLPVVSAQSPWCGGLQKQMMGKISVCANPLVPSLQGNQWAPVICSATTVSLVRSSLGRQEPALCLQPLCHQARSFLQRLYPRMKQGDKLLGEEDKTNLEALCLLFSQLPR